MDSPKKIKQQPPAPQPQTDDRHQKIQEEEEITEDGVAEAAEGNEQEDQDMDFEMLNGGTGDDLEQSSISKSIQTSKSLLREGRSGGSGGKEEEEG